MRRRTLAPPIWTVEIDCRWRVRSAPGPVIAGVNPTPASLGAAATRVEHWNGRIIGKQLLGCEDVFGQPGLQWLQPPHGSANPIGERRAVELNALPREDLALPIKRKVIAVFGDQHMGQESGRSEPFADRALRGGRLMNAAAGAAAITRSADADDPKPRRHMVKHLTDGLADQMQLTAAARAALALEIKAQILPGKVRR
jgi:hypothetical protein